MRRVDPQSLETKEKVRGWNEYRWWSSLWQHSDDVDDVCLRWIGVNTLLSTLLLPTRTTAVMAQRTTWATRTAKVVKVLLYSLPSCLYHRYSTFLSMLSILRNQTAWTSSTQTPACWYSSKKWSQCGKPFCVQYHRDPQGAGSRKPWFQSTLNHFQSRNSHSKWPIKV